jgi:hypothetical protein
MIRRIVAVALLWFGCAHQARPGRVERTPDGLVVRLAQFAVPPEAEPIEVDGLPEPPDAVDEYFNGPEEEEPVLGGGPRRPLPGPRAPPVLKPRTRTAIDRIIDGATLRKRYPGFHEHHLFPRQFRSEFSLMVIDVDAWTILVDATKHGAAHGQKDVFGAGGRWNGDWRTWRDGFRKKTGHDPAAEDAFEKASEMIGTFNLAPYGLLAPYGCGRVIAHDLYDIVEPPNK